MKLLLLPGLDGTAKLFDPFISSLGKSFSIEKLAYPTDEPLSYKELHKFIQSRLSFNEPFVIIAESFSGPLALQVASLKPKYLVAIILCGSFISNPLPRIYSRLSFLVRPFLFRFTLARFLVRYFLMGDDASKKEVDVFRTVFNFVHPKVKAKRVREILKVNITNEFIGCCYPILYLKGSEDKFIKENYIKWMRKLKPEMQCVEIKAPHLILHCQSENSAQVISEFIKSL